MPMNWAEFNKGKDLSEFGSRIFGSTDQNTDSPSFFEGVKRDFL